MNVMAIGCHPDDLEIGCGGTLTKLVTLGHTVTMIHVSDGDKGHKVIPAEELIAIRRQEAQEAGALIGAEVVALGERDLQIRADRTELVVKLTREIRRLRPDYIITHPPDDYMKDHMQVSEAVFDASFAATVPYYAPEVGEATASPVPIYYMDTLAGVGFLPSEYVDISSQMTKKLQMNACHRSQITWLKEHDGIDFLDFVTTVSKFRGLQCGTTYAEGFRQCQAWPRMTTMRLLP